VLKSGYVLSNVASRAVYYDRLMILVHEMASRVVDANGKGGYGRRCYFSISEIAALLGGYAYERPS
jgi:hypothetical protein